MRYLGLLALVACSSSATTDDDTAEIGDDTAVTADTGDTDAGLGDGGCAAAYNPDIDPALDADGDFFSDADEGRCHTEPDDARYFPFLDSAWGGRDACRLDFEKGAGFSRASYQMEHASQDYQAIEGRDFCDRGYWLLECVVYPRVSPEPDMELCGDLARSLRVDAERDGRSLVVVLRHPSSYSWPTDIHDTSVAEQVLGTGFPILQGNQSDDDRFYLRKIGPDLVEEQARTDVTPD